MLFNIEETRHPDGLTAYEFNISGTNVYGYNVPRDMTEEVMSRPEAGGAGIYIYIGRDESPLNSRTDAYIGLARVRQSGMTWKDRVSEGDGVSSRKERGWERTLFFTAENKKWSPDELIFLEWTLRHRIESIDSNNVIGGASSDGMISLTHKNVEEIYQFVDHIAEIMSELESR